MENYDIEYEAGEFPIRTDFIEPSIDSMMELGYDIDDATWAVHTVIVERPTINSVSEVVRAAVLMLKVG